MLTADAVRRQALELGFTVAGIAPATDLPELARLDDWLARGYAGEMEYLHKSAATRADIRRFLPSARSVIVTGTLYFTGQGPADGPYDRARVAKYAWGEDYHLVLAGRLEALVAWMRERTPEPFEAAIFVDKHHVQERVYARHAGIGWVGKNTCLINPDAGSYLLLAGVACSLALEPDRPVEDQCGACTLCLDHCPTGALVEPGVLDATRCISYLTIELEGPIPEADRPAVGDHLFGCDICQDVCPWNLAPAVTTDPAWQPRAGRAAAAAAELWQRTDQALQAFVRGSAMLHAPLARLRRNLAVVLGNAGDPRGAEALGRPGGGVRNAAHSARTPLVEAHVDWARRRVADRGPGTDPGAGNQE
ncbi:MAG: tRNA epoxyqueuosine(34) reductase QueG [Vicinamibacterales bacterium]